MERAPNGEDGTETSAPSVEAPATLTPDSRSSNEDHSSRLITIAHAWQRIKEHKVIQWGLGYFAAALALAHAEELIAHAYEWPGIVGQVLLLVLALGFLVALVLAWYHGHRGLTYFSPAEMSILVVLLLVGAGVMFASVKPTEREPFAATVEPHPSAAKAAMTPPDSISVAVLPFVNLSSDKEQEFFSDGMTEEITAALAKVPNLRVVGRTSAFQFKGANKDLRAIGQALAATHLIEGSVRKDGNEVRITAQLVKADDGTHLWTESYNRQLKGVFAIQEEIATAIAGALRVPLGLKEGQSLVSNRTADTDSYQDYLRAKALVRGRGPREPGGPLTEAAKLLEQAVARDPNYAPAWGLLGLTYAVTPAYLAAFMNGSNNELRRLAADLLQKAEAASQQATRLDPNNIDGYTALGSVRRNRGEYVQAEALYKQAFSLNPGNPDALHSYSVALALFGTLKDSLSMRLRLRAQEPLVPNFNRVTALVLWLNGRNDEALAILKTLPPTSLTRITLAQVYASMGRYSEAADALREFPAGIYRPEVLQEAVRLLRTAPARAASPQTSLSNGQLGFVYLYTGVPDRALDNFEVLVDAEYSGSAVGLFWAPPYAPLRKTERFKTLMRKAGFVDYWRARGWPDLCHSTTGDDFDCQ